MTLHPPLRDSFIRVPIFAGHYAATAAILFIFNDDIEWSSFISVFDLCSENIKYVDCVLFANALRSHQIDFEIIDL